MLASIRFETVYMQQCPNDYKFFHRRSCSSLIPDRGGRVTDRQAGTQGGKERERRRRRNRLAGRPKEGERQTDSKREAARQSEEGRQTSKEERGRQRSREVDMQTEKKTGRQADRKGGETDK